MRCSSSTFRSFSWCPGSMIKLGWPDFNTFSIFDWFEPNEYGSNVLSGVFQRLLSLTTAGTARVFLVRPLDGTRQITTFAYLVSIEMQHAGLRWLLMPPSETRSVWPVLIACNCFWVPDLPQPPLLSHPALLLLFALITSRCFTSPAGHVQSMFFVTLLSAFCQAVRGR